MTDSEIRHVTASEGNVFEDLGFEPQEAQALLAASNAEIDAALKLKRQLMTELASWMKERGLKQHEAAAILRVSRPRVSDLVHHKTAKFTLDTLVTMLARAGKTVRVDVAS